MGVSITHFCSVSPLFQSVSSSAPEFFDTSSFNAPKNLGEVSGRLSSNVEYFQANYSVLVALVLAYVCYHDRYVAFTLALLAGVGFWLFNVRKFSIQVSGRVFSENEVLIAFAVGAGSLLQYMGGTFLTYSLAFAGLLILVHAALKAPGVGQSATNFANEKLN